MSEGTELKEQPRAVNSSDPAHPDSEYNPCSNAKITSPFYLYAHDSPRPSFDSRTKPTSTPVVVQIPDARDLESGVGLSPTVSQEKREAQKSTASRLKFWARGQQCMTKPKQKNWLARLPPRQRLAVKILIGLVLAGVIVGIAVGISIRVNGGIYKSSNSTAQIGS